MSLLNTINKGIDLADQFVEDKDRKNELIAELQKIKLQTLFTGKGSSVTKITICALVAIITVGVFIKWFTTGDIADVHQLLYGVGMLIGAYGGGKTIQKVAGKKYDQRNSHGYRNQDNRTTFQRTQKWPERDKSPTHKSRGKRDKPSHQDR